MAAFTKDVLTALTSHRPARTVNRKRKARRGHKIKTLLVVYTITMKRSTSCH